jgi:hypothetical protein
VQIKVTPAGGPECPERLSRRSLPVRWALVRANVSNRGTVRMGDASVMAGDPGLAPGSVMGLRGSPWIDLYDVFLLVAIEGDGVEVKYAPYA